MTTRMIHPQHGATHAYDKSEIERLRGLGWTPEGEDKPAEVIALPVVDTPPKRKPGRPRKAE